MFHKTLIGVATALSLSVAPIAAKATELFVYHSWSAESEVAALNVLIDALAKKGITWSEIAIPHESESNVGLINLVTGGNPPDVFIESNPGFYRDLKQMGLAQPVTELFNSEHITENLPPAVVQSITVDGDIMKIPTAIHIDGMIYYNKAVAAAAGVDPTSWTSLDDMWADEKKVEDAGYTFMAMGGNTFQAGYLFHALVAAMAGPDIYYRLYGPEPDPTVFDEPALRDVIDMHRRITSQADDGWVNRSWADTTNTVITGKALMHLHGDWMKGQWRAAGATAGNEFGCINIPGTKALSVTVDAFGLLGGVDEETKQAEFEFAKIVTDPQIAADFAAKKGSTPVRSDAPSGAMDICNTVVLDGLRDIGGVQNPFNITDGDWHMSIWNVLFEFQSDPNMTDDDVIAGLKDEYDAIFG
ncbi:MAG: carbohydrate ABC transporter substrate-binding protein [Hyphomicrobiaceae bacterium]|nr:carbohydrate ABC transporter substrate-binding protein [Hyphomicrobiaceae bacterium]MCC0022764.1 carbohydrate ABC transporter substrate-binding protein [Hyphomicrobiaceae bacterium]